MLTMETLDFTVRGDGEYSRFEGWCLSADLKPTTGVLNGSRLTEMDTGTVYYFDEAGSRWLAFGQAADTAETEEAAEHGA